MIAYDPLWKTMKQKGVSTYALIYHHKISSSTVDRLRHNKGISTLKINDLCKILNCDVQDILQYVPSQEDQKL